MVSVRCISCRGGSAIARFDDTTSVPFGDDAARRQATPPPEIDGEQQVEREGFSLGKWLRSPRTLISFLMAFAIIAFASRGLDIDVRDTWQHLQQANLGLYLLGFVVFYATFPLRALRWRLLLRNAAVPLEAGRGSWASLPALTEYIGLSWFANCIVPAKLGDAYRGYLLKHNGGISFSTSIGTIFAERIWDMLMLFTLLVLSGYVTFGSGLMQNSTLSLIFGAGLVMVAIVVAGLACMRYLSPLVRRILPGRLLEFYERFESSALQSFRPQVLPRLLLLTTAIWLLEGFRLFFVIEALGSEGLHLPLSVIIFIALASSLLTALPLTPGGLGVIEFAVTTVLLLFLPMSNPGEQAASQSLALAVALLDRTINYWSIVVFGFILYLVSKRK
jgi:glycosyltransferase 2 family protein